MVRSEIAAQSSANRFTLATNTRHTHNGLDSPRINSNNLLPGLSTSGRVEFDNITSYTFNTGFQPKSVVFYGNPYHTSGGGIDRHTFTFGQAALGQNLYFQPGTNRSVNTGGQFSIVQTCTMFMALDSGGSSSFQTIASQTNLIHVEESGTVVAAASITGYNPSSFTITVTSLADGWIILGNYFVF